MAKMRQVHGTFKHTESKWTEEKTVTILLTDEQEKYELTKVFVVELNQSLIFCKNTNEFLVPD